MVRSDAVKTALNVGEDVCERVSASWVSNNRLMLSVIRNTVSAPTNRHKTDPIIGRAHRTLVLGMSRVVGCSLPWEHFYLFIVENKMPHRHSPALQTLSNAF